MRFRRRVSMGLCIGTGSILLSTTSPAHGANQDLNAQLETLRQENAPLQETVRKQESLIENLSQRVEQIETAATKQTATESPPEPASSKLGREGVSLALRTSNSLELNLGELHLDSEDVLKLWNVERLLNIRAGRFHANMHCVVLVLENPFFAVADEAGHYTISNVPPGTYNLKAWHERLPGQSQEIIVPAAGEVTVDFTLGIKYLPRC